MKFMLTLFIVFSSLLLQATPEVGDRTTSDLKISLEGITKVGTVTSELIAYDTKADLWTQTVDRVLDGKSTHEEHRFSTSLFFTQNKILHYLTNCEQESGKLENLKTALGTFKTCVIPYYDDTNDMTGYLWIGDVPFGILQQKGKGHNGNFLEIVVTSFNRGQKKY